MTNIPAKGAKVYIGDGSPADEWVEVGEVRDYDIGVGAAQIFASFDQAINSGCIWVHVHDPSARGVQTGRLIVGKQSTQAVFDDKWADILNDKDLRQLYVKPDDKAK